MSFIVLLFSVAFNQLSLSLELKSNLAKQMLLSGFSTNAYDVLRKKDDMAMGLPILSYGFFREFLPVTGVMGFILMLSIWLMLLPFLAIGYFVYSEQLHLLLDENASTVERFAAGFGVFEILSAVLVVLAFHVPMPFRKNIRHVRWRFLYKLEPHASDEEKFARWLERDKQA